MYPYIISLVIHMALLGIVMLWPHSAPPKHYTTMPIELTMVPLPMGDHGHHDRPSPKQAPSLRKSSVAQPPAPAKAVVQQGVQPRVPTPAKGTALDLDAALKKRFSDSSEAERAEQIAQAQEGSGNGGPVGVGLTGDGSGMHGEIAGRGVVHRNYPSYPDWAERRSLEGDVKLQLWVNALGEVTRVEVIGLSGTHDFDTRAVEALRQWKFTPLADPTSPEQVGQITIQYRLEKSS